MLVPSLVDFKKHWRRHPHLFKPKDEPIATHFGYLFVALIDSQ
jgi:hypothetical protein